MCMVNIPPGRFSQRRIPQLTGASPPGRIAPERARGSAPRSGITLLDAGFVQPLSGDGDHRSRADSPGPIWLDNAARRSRQSLSGAPVPGPAGHAGIPSGGILLRQDPDRPKPLRPRHLANVSSFAGPPVSFPAVSNFGARPPAESESERSNADRGPSAGREVRPAGGSVLEERRDPELYRTGERYPRADTAKGRAFSAANPSAAQRWLSEVRDLVLGSGRTLGNASFVHRARRLGLNPAKARLLQEAAGPAPARNVLNRRIGELFAASSERRRSEVARALDAVVRSADPAAKARHAVEALHFLRDDLPDPAAPADNTGLERLKAVMQALGGGLSPTGDVAGIAEGLAASDAARKSRLRSIVDRIEALSGIREPAQRRAAAIDLQREGRSLLRGTSAMTDFSVAIARAAAGEPPGRSLRRYTERSDVLSAAARGTRAFHDSIFRVDPRFENDPAVGAAALAGDTAGVLIGGIGAGVGVVKAVGRAERRRSRAAFPELEDIDLPPVTRAKALEEYRALNMPEASTETWLDIRTNRRGFLDDHEHGPHRGHTISRHIAISDQAVKDRVLFGNRDEASMFLNFEIAEAAISRVFDVRRKEIADWFRKKKSGSKQQFELEMPFVQQRRVGRVFYENKAEFVDAHTVVVRLVKVSNSEFRIFTAFVR